jgi:signal transduction histidine kinase
VLGGPTAAHDAKLTQSSPRATLGSAAGSFTRGARLALDRGLLSTGVALVALATMFVLYVRVPPVPIEVVPTANGAVVSALGVGSPYWVSGVRPGMTVELSDVSTEIFGSGAAIELSNYRLDLDLSQPGAPPVVLAVALLLVGLAHLLVRARIPGTSVALAAGVGVGLAPVGPQLGLPTATPLLLLPLLAGWLGVRVADARTRRRFDLAALALITSTLLMAALVGSGAAEPPWWTAFWWFPTIVAVGLALAGETLQVRWHLAQGDSANLEAAIPLAAASRIIGGDEERSRFAIELHNRVLPVLSRSMSELREGRQGSDVLSGLDDVADDLRALMQREQTVSLEIGGVAEALRTQAETLTPPGIEVLFDVRAGVRRPPARVEVAAYRIGQAALDNALRHSSADRVVIRVSADANHLAVTVVDDGVGIDSVAEAAARRRGRLGLAQMRLRAEAVGGALDVRPGDRGGTAVAFSWRP